MMVLKWLVVYGAVQMVLESIAAYGTVERVLQSIVAYGNLHFAGGGGRFKWIGCTCLIVLQYFLPCASMI